jgi:autotransporter-associated beta strand protein
MASPNQPRYDQFKESSRQSMNLGPALTRLISYSNGPAGGGTSIVRGRDSLGNLNLIPNSWKDFNVNDAPPNQQYLAGVSAVNLGTKNNGHPGDVYIGFFNPLHASFGNPVGTTYFMITNGLGAYLQDPTLLTSDTIQQITLDFNFGASGINSLQRLNRDTGLVEVLPLTHISGDHYRYIFNLEGGTGDLFKYNDGSPFVGIEQPTNALYWDNDGNSAGNNIATGAGLGGTGNWSNTASKWFNGATNGTWIANRTAVLWGTAGTVTLTAPQTAEGLQFKSNGYTLTGSTLTVSDSTIRVDSGLTGTINSTLAGSAGINKTGAGMLVLDNASNTYTAGTTVSAGVLRASADGNFGAAPGSFTAGNITLNGGTLRFGANFDINGNRGITLGVKGGTIDTQSFSTIHGYNSTDPNFDGGFRGDGDLTKLGSGTFFAAATTTGTNASWKGRLILKEGTWKIVASDGLPYNVPLAAGLQADQVTLDGGTWQVGATFSVTNARRGVTIAAGGGTIDTQSFNFTWAGPWAGNVPNAILNKVGNGTLRLNSSAMVGPSTYAGNMNVNGGTLQLDGGTAMGDLASINLANTAGVVLGITKAGSTETIGSLSGGGVNGGNVSLAANLVTGGNNKNTTFAGVISGAGALTKTGNGTMTVTGANTYMGATNINGGTFRVNNASGSGTGTGAVNVNSGTLGGTGAIHGEINVGNGGRIAPGASAGTLTAASDLALSAGAVLDYELANVTTPGGGINDLLSIDGGLTLGSSLTLNIDAYQGDLANGTYKLITYTGSLSGNTSGWTVGSSNASRSHGYSFSTATPGEIQLIVFDGSPTWTGAVSTSWSNGNNWTTGAEPNSSLDVVFDTPIPATGPAIALSSSEAAKTLTFNDSYTLTGGSLGVAGGNVSVASGKTATINSPVSGSAGLSKNGAGTLVLAGTNTYSGGSAVYAGTLRVASDSNLGNSGGTITLDGGTLNPMTSYSSARMISVSSGGGIIDNPIAITTTSNGTLSGTADTLLTKAGHGSLVLAQSSPRSGLSSVWLGDVAVSGGSLKVGNGGAGGFLPGHDPIAYAGLPPIVPTISVAAGSSLEFDHGSGGPTQDTTHAVVITGAGSVVIAGAKTEVFVANNTYTGPTEIKAGSSMRIGWGGPLNTGGLGNTAIANNGTLTFSNDHNTAFPGSISGAGTLLKEFSGTLTLTGALTHTGGTTIANGTLQIGNGGTTGSVSGNITNSSTLTFNRSDSYTHTGRITGSGDLIKAGPGTLTLAPPIAGNTYTGGTTVNGGTLLVSAGEGARLGFGPVVVNSGATLGGTGSIFGAVTLHAGAHLAPGLSIGSLYIGPLTITTNAVLDFELDTIEGDDVNDLVNVRNVGGLTIYGGTLNLTNAGNMTAGTYKLIEYDGSFNGSIENINLGAVPAGFDYELVDNSITKSIDLVVTSTGDFNADGFVNAADYVAWRKGLGAAPGAYDDWKQNFGRTLIGSNARSHGFSTIPEPFGGGLLSIAIASLAGSRIRYNHRDAPLCR